MSQILPKPILMRTNKRQNLEDGKSQNRHFRIGPIGRGPVNTHYDPSCRYYKFSLSLHFCHVLDARTTG
jgi:hypothetical protein